MGPGDYMESILRHGKNSAAQSLGHERIEHLSSLVWKRYYVLEQSAPQFKERVNRGLFVAAVPLVALYQSLQEDFGVEPKAALDLAERMLRDSYAVRMGPFMTAALNAVYQVRPVRRLLIARMTNTQEPEGFRFENIDQPETIMAFDVHACPIVNFAKKHGVPEIVPVICRLDDLIAEQLVGIELQRAGTIGMGAERCDFRYVRTR